MNRSIPLALVALFAAAAMSSAQEGRQSLREAVKELADKVKKVADQEDQKVVRVGRFTPSGLDDANSGDGISQVLAEALGKSAQADAHLEVSGAYGFVSPERGSAIKVIKIKAKMVNTKTLEDVKEFGSVEAIVGANPDIAKLLNSTVRIDPEGGYEDRNKKIQEGVKKKSVHIAGSLVSSAADSPFAVEVRVKPLARLAEAAKPRDAQDAGGLAFVPIEKNEVYEVRLVNRGRQEAAAAVTVDGIDVYAFGEEKRADGRPRFSHVIVPAEGEATVRGWHRTVDRKRTDNVLAFLVTENGKGVRSQFPQKGQGPVGCITVAFSNSYPKGAARGGAETGFGPPLKVNLTPVERTIDPAHDFVTIHYRR